MTADTFGLQWCRPISNREAKEEIARIVARRAMSGHIIGAGSGSTSFLTLLELAKRSREEQLSLSIVPTSLEIEFACAALGLTYLPYAPSKIDWCFDGADEVDPTGRLIKGRGGALNRERLVFAAASHRVVVADASKSVSRLGCNFPVPIEVDPHWAHRAFSEIERMEHVKSITLRLGVAKDGPVITEGGGVLFDAWFDQIDDHDEESLLRVPGVRCTGIFSGFTFERV